MHETVIERLESWDFTLAEELLIPMKASLAGVCFFPRTFLPTVKTELILHW